MACGHEDVRAGMREGVCAWQAGMREEDMWVWQADVHEEGVHEEDMWHGRWMCVREDMWAWRVDVHEGCRCDWSGVRHEGGRVRVRRAVCMAGRHA